MLVEKVLWGTMKWYDPDQKFGFGIPEDGGIDILIHRNAYIGDVPLDKNFSRDQHLEIAYMLVENRPVNKPKAVAWRFVKQEAS